LKVQFKTNQLSEAFQLLSSVIPIRSPRPTLNNVKIESRDGSVELSATDSEIALRYLISDVEIIEGGVISIPASKVTAILRETLDETVELESQGEEFWIRSKDSSYRIAGDDPHNFPFIPFIAEASSISVPSQLIANCIQKTSFATSKEKTRYALNGILLSISGYNLAMVATDGKRLALVQKTFEAQVEEHLEAIIPTKAMSILERVGESNSSVAISIQENLVQFVIGRLTLCAKLVEGTFPNYREVVPTNYSKKLLVNKEMLLSAVKRASLFTSEESKAVNLIAKDSILTLKARSDVTGDAQIQIVIEQKEELDIAVNPEFLIDILRVSDEENIVLEFMDFNRPLLIKPVEGYINVIMPISATT